MQRCRDCGCTFPEGEINGHSCTYVVNVANQSNNPLLKLYKEGTKHDQDKPDLSLLPKELLEETAKAFMYGEKKYGRHNFRNGFDHHRPAAAALRHIVAYLSGEDNDAESGVSHLGHAAASIGMLLYCIKNKVGKDTRKLP